VLELNTFEAVHLAVTALGVVLAAVGLKCGGNLWGGITAMAAAIVVPVVGPLAAVAYGVLAVTRARRRTAEQSPA